MAQPARDRVGATAAAGSDIPVTGGRAVVRALVQGGIETCFANPGTSEMHFVAALEHEPGLRGVLCLFEGVAVGAADGYVRMSGKPAAVLLHLASGVGNASSNLHNAAKARSGMVVLVGDHASCHWGEHGESIPSARDVAAVLAPFSATLLRVSHPDGIARAVAAAVQTANGGEIASVVLPADVSWRTTSVTVTAPPPSAPAQAVDEDAVEAACAALTNGRRTALLVGDSALGAAALTTAGRICARTGASLLVPTFNARIQRGAGRVQPATIPYALDKAVEFLAQYDQIVLAGAAEPVAQFAYPGKPTRLAPPAGSVLTLCRLGHDAAGALDRLAASLDCRDVRADAAPLELPELPDGPLDADAVGAVLCRTLPEGAIVVDESISVGREFYARTRTARPHDWLKNMGAAIGVGNSLAVGASVACPDRPVITVEGDGSMMYMPQALWTQAREGLDVVTVVLANRKYAILRNELGNVGASGTSAAVDRLLDIDSPTIDFVGLAQSMGVPAVRATTPRQLEDAIGTGVATRGPVLIEAVLP